MIRKRTFGRAGCAAGVLALMFAQPPAAPSRINAVSPGNFPEVPEGGVWVFAVK